MRGGFAILALCHLGFCVLSVYKNSILLNGNRVFYLWDDAMVSMRYAANLASGHGLVWNAGGEPTLGVSNMGVTLIMALAHLPTNPVSPTLTMQALHTLFSLGTILIPAYLAFCLYERISIAFLVCLSCMACFGVHYWCMQGSDVGYTAIWLLVGSWLVLNDLGQPNWQGRCFLVWLALGPILRLDLISYAVLFAIFAALRSTAPVRLMVKSTLTIVLCMLGLFLLTWLYFGDPLPNTFYLKMTGGPRYLVFRSAVVQLIKTLYGLFLVGGVSLALLWHCIRTYSVDRASVGSILSGPLGMGCLWSLTVLMTLVHHLLVGGDWAFNYSSRFIAPVMPLAMLAALVFISEVVSAKIGIRRIHNSKILIFGMLFMALSTNTRKSIWSWIAPSMKSRSPAFRCQEEGIKKASYLNAAVIMGTTVAYHCAGRAYYLPHLPAIDVLGKSDTHIARLKVTRFVPGHSKWDWDYIVNDQRPDIILETSRKLDRREDFKRAYVHVDPESVRSFFIRRSALGRLLDPNVELEEL